MNVVSQWWIGGLRTRKAKVVGSIPAGGSRRVKYLWSLLNFVFQCMDVKSSFMKWQETTLAGNLLPYFGHQLLLRDNPRRFSTLPWVTSRVSSHRGPNLLQEKNLEEERYSRLLD